MDAPESLASLEYYRIAQLFHQLQGQGVKIPEADDVREYLMSHPGLTDVVATAVTETMAQLRGKAELSLEVYRDTEISDVTLTLYVRPYQRAAPVRRTVEQVMDSLEPELRDASGWLTIMLDYRPRA
jgi:hypothetical protein